MAVKVGSLYAEVFAQTGAFQNGMMKVDATLAGTQKKFAAFGDSMSAIGQIAAVAAAGTFAKTAVSAAMKAQESENLFEVSMGNMAGSARKWSEEISKSLGLNAYAVRENVAKLNVMLTSMGQTESQAYNMSTSMTQLAYDMASFYTLDPTQAFEKLRSGISGESEPLKQLGIIVNETTVKNYAYTNGIAKMGSALTENEKVLARYGVIMKATAKAQGDLELTGSSTTNRIRKLTEQYNQLLIKLGTGLLPVVNLVTIALSGLMWVMTKISTPMLAAGAAAATVILIMVNWVKICKAVVLAYQAITTAAATASAAAGNPTAWAKVGLVLLAAAGTWALFNEQLNKDTKFNPNKITDGISKIGDSINDANNLLGDFNKNIGNAKPGDNLNDGVDPLTARALKLKELVNATHEAREAEMQRRRGLIGWKSNADLWKDTAVLGEQSRFSAKGFGKNELWGGYNENAGNQGWSRGSQNDLGISNQDILNGLNKMDVDDSREKRMNDMYRNFIIDKNTYINKGSDKTKYLQFTQPNKRTWSDKPNDYTAESRSVDKLDKQTQSLKNTEAAIVDIRNMMRNQTSSNLLAQQG